MLTICLVIHLIEQVWTICSRCRKWRATLFRSQSLRALSNKVGGSIHQSSNGGILATRRVCTPRCASGKEVRVYSAKKEMEMYVSLNQILVYSCIKSVDRLVKCSSQPIYVYLFSSFGSARSGISSTEETPSFAQIRHCRQSVRAKWTKKTGWNWASKVGFNYTIRKRR